jgi:aminoglycoside phosphotransferase family enzyme
LASGTDGDFHEWCVHMRRFDQLALLSYIARKDGTSCDLARELTDLVHDAHQHARRSSPSLGGGIRDLAASMSAVLSKSGIDCGDVERLAHRLESENSVSAAHAG